MEHEVHIISGKIASDPVPMFVSYRPQLALNKLVQYLKGGSSRVMLQAFPRLRKQFWGRHLPACCRQVGERLYGSEFWDYY